MMNKFFSTIKFLSLFLLSSLSLAPANASQPSSATFVPKGAKQAGGHQESFYSDGVTQVGANLFEVQFVCVGCLSTPAIDDAYFLDAEGMDYDLQTSRIFEAAEYSCSDEDARSRFSSELWTKSCENPEDFFKVYSFQTWFDDNQAEALSFSFLSSGHFIFDIVGDFAKTQLYLSLTGTIVGSPADSSGSSLGISPTLSTQQNLSAGGGCSLSAGSGSSTLFILILLGLLTLFLHYRVLKHNYDCR